MNFYIVTLGCKVNQYESRMMSELLMSNGYQLSDDPQRADICIINSCTVTATGDAKCRKMIHRMKRENPGAMIVLCGCMPQAFPDELSLFDGCDIVLGNTSRREIVPAIDEYLSRREQVIHIKPHEKGERFEEMRVSSFSDRTRAYIKIEDGCNRFCSYCIIPYARGRVRSKSIEEIRQEALSLSAQGFREAVVVGINLSAYGEDISADLVDAVTAVSEAEGIKRVRLGSIEPERMDRETLIKLSRIEKFCPHFHLSLQSGCTETLRRMRRHYTAEDYRKIVSDIREIFENPSITTDIMVGFVGESEEEFEDSLSFCREIGFARSHVFSYSRRKGTTADRMEGHLPEQVKSLRSGRMIAEMKEKEREFLSSQVGRTLSVLFETKDKNGRWEGYTENYTKVKVYMDAPVANEILPVTITGSFDDYCEGEIVSSSACKSGFDETR